MKKTVDYSYYFILLEEEGLKRYKNVENNLDNKEFIYPYIQNLIEILDDVSEFKELKVYKYQDEIFGDNKKRFELGEIEETKFLFKEMLEVIDNGILDEESKEFLLYYAMQKEAHVMFPDSWFINRLGVYFSNEFMDALNDNDKTFSNLFIDFNNEDINFSKPEYLISDYKRVSMEKSVELISSLSNFHELDNQFVSEEYYFKDLITKSIDTNYRLYVVKKFD